MQIRDMATALAPAALIVSAVSCAGKWEEGTLGCSDGFNIAWACAKGSHEPHTLLVVRLADPRAGVLFQFAGGRVYYRTASDLLRSDPGEVLIADERGVLSAIRLRVEPKAIGKVMEMCRTTGRCIPALRKLAAWTGEKGVAAYTGEPLGRPIDSGTQQQ